MSSVLDTAIRKLYPLFVESGHVTTDSRQVKPGSLFFALPGESFDGNVFAEKAILEGAAAAVIDNEAYMGNGCILVDNVLQCLQELARFHRLQCPIPVLAITGSNGKTTTKELVSAVLSSSFHIISTHGNLNNHIGVPLTILSIRKDTEIAVVEMGANHVGEIAELCSMAMPDVGIITNIGKAHLGGFGGFEGVITAKSELYNWLRSHDGTVLVNSDDALLSKLSHGIRKIEYGPQSRENGTVALVEGNGFLRFDWTYQNCTYPVTTHLVGDYNLPNALAALGVGLHFGVSPEAIAHAISSYTPSNNRSQLIEVGNNRIVLDAYNANPSSMSIAINNFAKLAATSKLMILGDMLELGQESQDEHRHIIDLVLQPGMPETWLVGPEFSKVAKDRLLHFPDSAQAALYLKSHLPQHTTILLKGSRGIKMEKIREALE